LNWTTVFPNKQNASDYGPEEYRIVGIPGASDAPLQTMVSGSPGADWQAYWDNGASEGYLVPFGNDPSFRCLQGRAFWLIRKGAWTINTSVPVARLDSSNQADIIVHPGWNLVTNPFTTPVPWSVVQSSNAITDPIFKFDGSFSLSDTFDPYIGYYFFNSGSRVVLCIPPPGDGSGNALLPPVNTTVQGSGGWQVNVHLAVGTFSDESAWLGTLPDAGEGMDSHDFRKPRGVGDLPAVYFDRPEWDPTYRTFASDIRQAAGDDVKEWTLTVSSQVGKTARLVFRGVEQIVAPHRIFLIDPARMVHVDLQGNSVYEFVPVTSSSTFRLVVGDEGKVSDLLSSLETPGSFVLEGNFPNPFNPSTMVSVLVPNGNNVALRVYDALGREVRILFDGRLPAGRHFVEWDGRDGRGSRVSSGVYYCRLTSNQGEHQMLKMVLLK
jgi:hypothetical protein